MKEAERLQLARILSTVDENFLIALANKGLVRRAQKDLEGVTLQIEEADDAIVVRGADWTVRMPAGGPSKATDDTIATGITRQILSATIYLRDHWSASQLGTVARPKDENSYPSESNQVLVRESSPETLPPVPTKREDFAPPQPVLDGISPQGMPKGSVLDATETIDAIQKSDAVVPKEPIETTDAHPPVMNEAAAVASKFSDAGEGEALKNSLLEISVDELSKWAGKKLVSDLLVLLNENLEVEVECHLGVTIRLPQQNVEIRLLPTADRGKKLLEQLLSTAPKAMHKHWVATALLVLARKSGKNLQLSSSRVSVEAPRNQKSVLRESRKLLESILDNGVSHPSTRVVERLFTLSISASVVQLPRLSNLLKTLSDEISHLLSRHAAANTHQVFSTMSRTYSLIRALEKHAQQNVAGESGVADLPRELAGVARSQYDPAGDIELTGVGAYHWETASGYQGLTVLFWDRNAKRFLTWSMSRPGTTITNADVRHSYDFDVVWSGSSPQRLSRSTFLLKNARVNPFGRLSSAQQTSAQNISKSVFTSDIFEDRSFSNWRALRSYAVQQFPVGLKLKNPLDRIVVLEPKSWNDRFYDETHQRFSWDLQDGSGDVIRLSMPWNTCNESAIEFLESLKPGVEKISKVVARIEFSTSGLMLEPISMLSPGTRTGDTVLNPSFDHRLIEAKQSALLLRLRQKFGRDKIASAMAGDEDWSETQNDLDITQDVPPHLVKVIAETEGILLQVAESGTQRLNEKTAMRFHQLGEKLTHSGLLALGESIASVSTEDSTAHFVLWSDYLCSLHKQTLSLAAVGSSQ